MNTTATLPAEFVAFLKNLMEQNQRSIAAAHRSLIGRWQAGYNIPGYGTWHALYVKMFPGLPIPKNCPRGLQPRGWSLRNLCRYQPTKAQRVLKQHGLHTALSVPGINAMRTRLDDRRN